MIHPRPNNVSSFLWNHLEQDLRVLGQSLDQNLDSTAVTVHLILNECANFTAGDSNFPAHFVAFYFFIPYMQSVPETFETSPA